MKKIIRSTNRGCYKLLFVVSVLILSFCKCSESANRCHSGSEFKVNTVFAKDQSESSVATFEDGRFVVAWESYDQDGSGSGIYAQLFDGNGSREGSEFKVNTVFANDQSQPSVATFEDGRFVVAWESDDQDGSGSGIYAQLFDDSGSKEGTVFRVNTVIANDQSQPSVATFEDGKFVVVWESDGQDGDSSGIYAQLFYADGTKKDSEFQVNTHFSDNQQNPSIATFIDGQFAVVWGSEKQDGEGLGIYCQVFYADGTKKGTEFQVNYTTSDQQSPSIATFQDGEFIITWESENQDGGYGIYGQVFGADGTKKGTEFQANNSTTSKKQSSSVATFQDGQFIITWESENQDGDGYGIFGQVFNADRTKKKQEFQVNS
ncbi:fatty acid-binding protein [Anaeramoeba flamelloides]|uniref:Fatty acid-binding protein n=1 Tax=Anaeramoeba flamelloides TaxID=1746091 RepID=A0ABQ8Z0D1_9EUKA|nr:fatty acid-binding protein [Anaeramoeba flamelloides]